MNLAQRVAVALRGDSSARRAARARDRIPCPTCGALHAEDDVRSTDPACYLCMRRFFDIKNALQPPTGEQS
jgi:hypothetical protein